MSSTQEQWRAMLAEQPVLPSPMCGISDFAFRTVCRAHGGPLAYTQMVSSEGIYRGDRKTYEILDLPGDLGQAGKSTEPRLGFQLFGVDPEKLAFSAKRLEEMGAAVVDLNMGCPAKKITEGSGGSALLRRPDLVRRIFRAMRAALSIPFTTKMRWDCDDGSGAALEIAVIAEEEGVDGLCLHARTRKEGYSGKADWGRIRQLKEVTSLPILGNGDVRSAADAVAMMRTTGCDGVMIGRGAIGAPWLVGRALEAVRTGNPSPPDWTPDWETRRGLMLDHARLMAESKGMRRGIVQFRKHAAAYLRGIRGARQMRPRLMQATDLESLAEALVLPVDEPEFHPATTAERGSG